MIARGLVVTGKGEGKKIGYPTANIEHAASGLEPGVYCVRALIGSRVERGLAVVGMWVQKNNLASLEVYFLDLSADLYGQDIAVVLEKRLRDLQQFSSVEALLAQIGKDVEDARSWFESTPSISPLYKGEGNSSFTPPYQGGAGGGG